MKPHKLKCTIEEHHAHAAVGSSSLRTLIDRSPAHFLWDRQNPSESTPTQKFGQAIHQALLEPKDFESAFVIEPKFEGKGSQAARAAWHLENHGKTILKQDQYDAIAGIRKSVLAHKWAAKVIAAGAPEESLFCEDPDTGIQLKARPDFLREGHILVDVKSTMDASYHSFHKDIANFGYHIQAALYLDVASAVFANKFDTFIILAVEKEPPYAVQCFQLEDICVLEGRALYLNALRTLKKCMDSGSYPAYTEEITPISLPTWAYKVTEL